MDTLLKEFLNSKHEETTLITRVEDRYHQSTMVNNPLIAASPLFSARGVECGDPMQGMAEAFVFQYRAG